MQDRPLGVPMLLRRVESLFSHKRVVTATATGETEATWGEVAHRSRLLATALDLLEVPPQARVATFGWNSQRHLELYVAAPASGRVLHTLNHRLFSDQLAYILHDAADDVAFVDRTLLPTVWPVLDTARTLRWILVMDDGGDAPIPDDPRVLDHEQLLTRVDTPAPLPDLDERTAAGLCYTSGTTGPPKGVLSSHRSLALHALMLLGTDTFAIGERDVVMPIVPMFHVTAWGLPYAAMLAGSDLVLPGPATAPHQLLDRLSRHRVTFSAGVPAIWRSLLPLVGGADLTHLRMVVSGGSALPESLAEEWERATGVPLSSSWGMTETSPLVACARIGTVHDGLSEAERRAVRCLPGPPVPLTELRLVDDAGAQVPRDGASPGELQVAGPTIAAGYYGASGPDADPSFTEDGWLRTGDVATIDGLGYLAIVDRTKDLVKSGGEWISSVALENALMAHPDVQEAAVVAVQDQRWGERPVAFVVARAGRAVDEGALRAHLTGRVASWWVPDRFVFAEEIPKTGTGKIAKLVLRERLSQDR